MRKVSIFVASSLDGMIAPGNGDMSWLSSYAEDYGYSTYTQGIGTLLMGRKTFENVIRSLQRKDGQDGQWPYLPHQEVLVITRHPEKQHHEYPNLQFMAVDDLEPFLNVLKSDHSRKDGIDIVGGSNLISSALRNGLVDEMTVNLVPKFLGHDGIPLMADNLHSPIKAHLLHSKAFPSGLVQLAYSFQ